MNIPRLKTLLAAAAIAALSFVPAAAQDTVRLTLDSCLRYAYRHNLQVRAAQLGQESAEAGLTGARIRFLPSISASASQGLDWSGDRTTRSGQYGINGSLTLFSGLNNLRTFQQSKVSADQSMLKVHQTENNIGIQIVSAYLTILMNEEKLAYQREVVKTSLQQKEEGELKYRVGRILESDYLLLEANYTSAAAEIDNTLFTIADNRNTLYTLLDFEEGSVLDVVPLSDTMKAADFSVLSRDSLIEQARRSMPDWQISEMDVSIARYNVGLAQSAFLPTVSLNGGVGYNEGSVLSETPATNINGGLNSSLTLGVNVPLLNRGSSLTQLKQSKISLQQAELQHQQTLIDLTDRLDEMHLATLQALNRFRATEALATAYRASYDVYVIKYAEGAVTTVEMLQQQDRYLSALNDYLQSKYSFLLAEKQLDIYTGQEIRL